MYGPTTDFGEQLHAMKYRQPGETFRDAMNRIATALTDERESYMDFREILLSMRFMPAGRIQAAVGAVRRTTPYNCYVSGIIPDSFVDRNNDQNSSIMHRAEQAAATMRLGGGIGYDFSTLRPNGALIKTLQSTSSGVVPFMKIFDHTGKATSSAGHRRGAQMGVLRVDHPDIPIFVNAKHDQDTLSGFNISVAVTDQFMEHLETGKAFPLVFGGRTYTEIDPTALWETIMQSTWSWGEPGVLFIDQINRMNNLYYCETLAATNPCVTGETEILTKKGWVRIDSVVGEKIDVWNGHEWSEVEPKITGLNQQTMIVKFSDGSELNCTPYHKFILADGSRIEARYLNTGDALSKNSYPVIDSGIDYEGAYQQGFLSGDGWIEKDGNAYIALYGKKKELVTEFNSIVTKEYQCTGGYSGSDNSQTNIRVKLGKNMLKKDFVPDTTWSVKSRLEWLAGLADSDGAVVYSHGRNGSKSIEISCKDRSFAVKIRRMLNTLGIDSAIGPMKDVFWRFAIKASDLQKLILLGFNTRRLDIKMDREVKPHVPYVRVVGKCYSEIVEKVYCFTDYKNHSGVFDGVYTAQCGEQPLPPFGACLLGSFNLIQYVRQTAGGGYEFDWENFIDDIPVVVEAMDNVIDIAIYPLPEQEAEAKNKRRMGLGYTALANAAETLGFPYGSQEFLKFQEAIGRTLMNESYRASALLASRKGSFPLYDAEKYLKGLYVQGLDPDVLYLIRRYGIRNSHLTSIAPTGTISMAADNVSSGAEPVFSLETQRPVNTPDGQIIATLQDYAFGQFGTLPKLADSVSIQEHLDVLVTAQKYVDSAVSKTCNVSPDMPWDEFKGVYKKAFELGCKGLTTFNPEGKRMTLLKKSSAPKPVVITSVQQDKNEDMYNLALATAGDACTFDPATGRKSCE